MTAVAPAAARNAPHLPAQMTLARLTRLGDGIVVSAFPRSCHLWRPETAEKPGRGCLFGIGCGMQLLNVAQGGNLFLYIPEDLPHVLPHADWMGPNHRHALEVEPDSLMGRVFGGGEICVDSMHHMAIDEVSPCFRVTARSAAKTDRRDAHSLSNCYGSTHPQTPACILGRVRVERLVWFDMAIAVDASPGLGDPTLGEGKDGLFCSLGLCGIMVAGCLGADAPIQRREARDWRRQVA